MRTDRTFVCVACRARTWPVRRCPCCGESGALGDLEVATLRDLEAKRGVPIAQTDGIGCAAWTSVPISIAAALVAFGNEHVGLAEGLGAVALVATVVALLRRRAPAPRAPYRVLESPVVRAAARRVARRGKVRARATIHSPIEGRACVAFRLVGEPAAEMPLDDGRAVAFTLLSDRDEIEVEAGVATLDLALRTPARARPIDGELERWLAARGIEARGEIVAQEGSLVEGDEVEVIGTPREETAADGYRGHATRLVLADVPGSPLIVRSPPA